METRLACLACAWIVGATALAAEPLSLGLYDVQRAGGTGAQVDGLVPALAELGYAVETFDALTPLNLARFDIVYLSDMHHPGNRVTGWRQNLDAYVRAGGSVLQTWHHHIFPEVGRGVQRVYGQRRMIVREHPATAGVADFEASFSDHIIERVGEAGTPVLVNEQGQVVAAAGELGQGKVISTGLALAIPGGTAARPPRGGERDLLAAFLRWLAPARPASERLAALLVEPRLEVHPAVARVAAGRPATFTASAGSLAPILTELLGDGLTVTAGPAVAGGLIRSWRVNVATNATDGAPLQREVSVQVGDQTLTATLTVEPVVAEPPADEIRGVWIHVGDGREPEVVYPELASYGINTAVLRSAGGTAAFYAGSRVQPDIQDPRAAAGGDWLRDSVVAATAHGVAFHPYVNNLIVEGRTSPESLASLAAAGRLMLDPDGRELGWFCPSQEVNLTHITAVMVEMATLQPVAGVQYDFIRYPNDRGCFCTHCRTAFEAQLGGPAEPWPAAVLADGAHHAAWIEFRCDRISRVVERTTAAIRQAAPGVRISAAVFPEWPDCRRSVGQDWVRWCAEGWLDLVCPMNYTLDPDRFAARTRVHREALPAGFPLVEGIGIQAGPGTMQHPDEVALQIALARQLGCQGWIGFAYRAGHTASLFAPLADWLGVGQGR